jgi:transcription initiation factor TFIIIB Brf1 subunit/transcription initiation factor TFIIB
MISNDTDVIRMKNCPECGSNKVSFSRAEGLICNDCGLVIEDVWSDKNN